MPTIRYAIRAHTTPNSARIGRPPRSVRRGTSEPVESTGPLDTPGLSAAGSDVTQRANPSPRSSSGSRAYRPTPTARASAAESAAGSPARAVGRPRGRPPAVSSFLVSLAPDAANLADVATFARVAVTVLARAAAPSPTETGAVRQDPRCAQSDAESAARPVGVATPRQRITAASARPTSRRRRRARTRTAPFGRPSGPTPSCLTTHPKQ